VVGDQLRRRPVRRFASVDVPKPSTT
jgi:hypothetical protein